MFKVKHNMITFKHKIIAYKVRRPKVISSKFVKYETEFVSKVRYCSILVRTVGVHLHH